MSERRKTKSFRLFQRHHRFAQFSGRLFGKNKKLMKTQTFYSNGKLLITGEYVVLDGAKALALPTKFGQNLVVTSGINHQIKWTSFDADKSIWFQDTLSFSEIKNKYISEKNHDVKNTLKAAADFYKGILKANDTIKKNIASINQSLKASKVDINPKWGTGTLGIAKKYQAQMDKTAKELGVSLKGSELDKQISELYNLAESGQGLIDDLNAALRTIGKS